MQAFLITLGFKLGDMQMWRQFLHSKLGLTIASLALGIIGTLGFAPYGFWVVTLITLSFEFLLAATLNTKKQVFWSLWLYFTALNAATLSWLNFVMHGFGQMPLPLSWLLEILLSAYLAIFHGLLGCVAFRITHRVLPSKNNTKRKTAHASSDTKASPIDDFDTDESLNEDEILNDHDASGSSKLKEGSLGTHKTQANFVTDTEQNKVSTHTEDSKQSRKAAAQKANHQGENHFYQNAFLLCFLPLALILADYLVGIVFTGFPWMYVGYIALEGPFSAFAPLLGVRGITLILFICAGALALTLERRYVYLPVAGVLFAVGIFCQGLNFTQDLPAIKVTGIQGNIAQQVKWSPNQVMPTIGLYVDQTMPYFGRSELIIWPESALPVFAQEIEPILQDLNTAAYNSKTPLLTGIQHVDFVNPKKVETFNSIYLLGNSDNVDNAQIYKKRQLVPFGERVPFESVTRKLGSIFNFPMSGFTAGPTQQKQLIVHVTQTHADTDSSTTQSKVSNTTSSSSTAALTADKPELTGNEYELIAEVAEVIDNEDVIEAKAADSKSENIEELAEGEQEWFNTAVPKLPTANAQTLESALDLHFIPAICYESIFPELMTSLHDDKTNGIIMISNDSWFGNTRGPDEHLAIARMRSMEMQKPMIRITNSGHSVLIDRTGKVTYRLPQDKLAVLHGDFVPNQGMTPYVRWNNIPLYIILALLCFIGLYLRQRSIDPIQQNLEALVRP